MDPISADIMYNRNVAHSSSCKFKRKFELQNVCKDFKFVNINIKTLPFIYGLNLEQYDVDVILNKLNFHLKIVCPIERFNGLKTLKIKIYNTNKQKELASCVNFLQRHKNLHLSLNVLRKCSRFFEERKIVLQSLSEAMPDYLVVSRGEDTGYCIRCTDRTKNFVFFESNWSIGWNYKNYDVFDFIDFILNNKDKTFNANVKPIMKMLTCPHNNADEKLKLWHEVINYVRTRLEGQNTPGEDWFATNGTQNCFPGGTAVKNRYKNLLESKDFYLIHPEIIEIIDSDEDVCMEIDDDSDNDVTVVNEKRVQVQDSDVIVTDRPTSDLGQSVTGGILSVSND